VIRLTGKDINVIREIQGEMWYQVQDTGVLNQ
jgi:hypothetical protein